MKNMRIGNAVSLMVSVPRKLMAGFYTTYAAVTMDQMGRITYTPAFKDSERQAEMLQPAVSRQVAFRMALESIEDILSDYQVIKSPGKAKPRRLHELEEGSGLLLQVTELESFHVTVFSWGTIIFPSDLEARLHELIGRRISAFRLDGHYYVREILEQ